MRVASLIARCLRYSHFLILVCFLIHNVVFLPKGNFFEFNLDFIPELLQRPLTLLEMNITLLWTEEQFHSIPGAPTAGVQP